MVLFSRPKIKIKTLFEEIMVFKYFRVVGKQRFGDSRVAVATAAEYYDVSLTNQLTA